ncbi:hypothetical protein Z948_3254 [Sulfitobacter donghicola DSW-25 = KCTC 12864 = JCM 14565]|nr:hypothetical protein Z948_3254 [Sulfitobacter donghicola DSW-25 = KCTC 12864 = JCM 14565]
MEIRSWLRLKLHNVAWEEPAKGAPRNVRAAHIRLVEKAAFAD